jgi:hypothetical protein
MVPWVKILIGIAAGVPIFIFGRKFLKRKKEIPKQDEEPKKATEPEPESGRRWLTETDSASKTDSKKTSDSASKTDSDPKKTKSDSDSDVKGVERLIESEEDRAIIKANPFVSNLLDDLTAFYAANKAAYMGVVNGCLELMTLERPDSIPVSRWKRMKPKLVAQVSGSVVRALRDLRASLSTEEQRTSFDAAAAEIQQICNDHQFNAFQDTP